MQTATANNINFPNSVARNAPDEQKEWWRGEVRGKRETRRRHQNDDNEGVGQRRRIEMLTVAFMNVRIHTNLCIYIYTRTYMCVCECALISIRVCFGVFKAGITSYKQPLLTTTFLCCSSARRTIIITKAAYESWQHIVNTNTIGRGRAREHESRWASQSCQRQQPIGVNLHWQSREQHES